MTRQQNTDSVFDLLHMFANQLSGTPPTRRYWHIFDFFSIVICLLNEIIRN